MVLDATTSDVIRSTPLNRPVPFSAEDLEEVAGYLAATANHTTDKRLERRLDKLFERVEEALNQHFRRRQSAPQKSQTQQGASAAVKLAEWTVKELSLADSQIEKRGGNPLILRSVPTDGLKLTKAERLLMIEQLALSTSLQVRLVKSINDRKPFPLTVGQMLQMCIALAEAIEAADGKQLQSLLNLATKVGPVLKESLGKAVVSMQSRHSSTTGSRRKSATSALYQFKITMRGSRPPIWRRIQVKNCTLDRFHSCIQAAMGWENCHLYRFQISETQYADQSLFDGDFEGIDSRKVKLSDVLPEDGNRFRFLYEYDFGDGWEHEILFEGCPRPEKGVRYPLCLEGERACPPEDVGGMGGFEQFLEIVADPKHPEHRQMVDWIGKFDAEAFSVDVANQALRDVR
jgi:hypothetical protein